MNSISKIPKPANDNGYLKDHIRLLRLNYFQLLKRPLVPLDYNDEQAAEYLFNAPMVLLSHNTDADPTFNYANRAGLELFELTWNELTQLPSRNSAERVDQNERQALLDKVSEDGYIENYQGIRIAKSGRRFRVNNATVWNLYDVENTYQGQAACFSEWLFLD